MIENNTNKKHRSHSFREFAGRVDEVFSVSQAAEILELNNTDAAKTLARWCKQGQITRLRRGLYAIIPIELSRESFELEDPWLLIPKLYTPCYIGGWTAAEHWDLTEQIFNSIVVLTNKQVPNKEVLVNGKSFWLKHIPESQLYGTKTIWRKNEKIMVSDIHRTIIDLFNDPECGGGILHAMDCLICYLKKPEANLEKIAEYAVQLDNGAVYKRLGYILSVLVGPTNPVVLLFQAKLSQGNAYLDPKQKQQNRLIKKWRLFIPKTLSIGIST